MVEEPIEQRGDGVAEELPPVLENLVGWVKGSFFKCRRFYDRADLEAQLAQWLVQVNTQRLSRTMGVIPAVRLEQERARLRALPIPPTAYALTPGRPPPYILWRIDKSQHLRFLTPPRITQEIMSLP